MPRILLLLVVAVVLSDAVDVNEDVVGNLDLNHIEIVVSDGPTFPPEQVATALREDPILVPATHFFAPRRDLLRLVTERCVTGYHASGFPAPRVSAKALRRGNGERLVVQIVEGERLRWGSVRISDPGPIGEEALRQRLCAPWRAPDAEADDEPEDPLIVIGAPARFDAVWNRNLTRTIADFYGLEGFQDCRPVVQVGEAKDGMVDCLISFTTPPRAMVVDSVSVTGVTHNTPEAVVAWLDRTANLRRGGTATKVLMNQAREALTASGRFYTTTLTATPIPDHPERVAVVLKAIDGPLMPRIDQALSDTQQQALRWREQVMRDLENGSLSITASSGAQDKAGRWTICFNARHGCVIRVTKDDPRSPIDVVSGFSEQHLFYRSRRLERSAAMIWEATLKITLSFATSEDPDKPHTFNFQLSTTTDPDDRVSDITVTPAFVLSQISQATRVGDRLITEKETSSVIVDLSGPTMFELRSKSKEAEDDWQMQVTRTAWTDLVQQTAGVPAVGLMTATTNDGRELFALVSDDLAPVIAHHAGLDEPALRLWLAAGVGLASQWLAGTPATDEPKQDTYRIPLDLAPDQWLAQYALMIRRMILDYTKDYWASSSWPVLIVNEACAVMSGRNEHTRAVLTHLVDGSGMGPVGHGLLALLLKSFDPRLSRTVAGLGHNHLTVDAWTRDLATLVPRLPPVRTALLSINHPQTAAQILPEAQRAGFVELVQRAGREQTPAEEQELLDQLLRFLWYAGGERLLREWLTDLQREPATSGEPP